MVVYINTKNWKNRQSTIVGINVSFLAISVSPLSYSVKSEK